MRKILLLAWILFLVSAGWVLAQEGVFRYLDEVEKKYSGLKDYTVGVKVHFDVEALKAPDMQARLYFKAPDKMTLDSKRIFFFPKEGGFFNPFQFSRRNFDVIFLEYLTYDGRKAVKVRLIPVDIRASNKGFVMIIDIERNLIREIKASPAEGREIIAVIEYGTFDGFDLPVHVELQLDMPSAEPNGAKEFQLGQGGKRIHGKVEITYSNYKVNSGLSDEIFKEKGFR